MKLKLDKLPTMTQFLAENPGVSEETYKAYQQAAKEVRAAGRQVARQLGGRQSDIFKPMDIRQRKIKNIAEPEEYLRSVIRSMRNLVENANVAYTTRQDSYLRNLLTLAVENSDYELSGLNIKFQKWLRKATDEQKAKFIKSLGPDVGKTFYTNNGEVNINLDGFYRAVKRLFKERKK